MASIRECMRSVLINDALHAAQRWLRRLWLRRLWLRRLWLRRLWLRRLWLRLCDLRGLHATWITLKSAAR